jgi:hypothetical protein
MLHRTLAPGIGRSPGGALTCVKMARCRRAESLVEGNFAASEANDWSRIYNVPGSLAPGHLALRNQRACVSIARGTDNECRNGRARAADDAMGSSSIAVVAATILIAAFMPANVLAQHPHPDWRSALGRAFNCPEHDRVGAS